MNQTDNFDRASKVFADLARALCSRPDDLDVSVVPGRKAIFTLRPHPTDFGSLCGRGEWNPVTHKRQGRHIAALRTVASCITSRLGGEATVILEEREVGQRLPPPHQQFAPEDSWDCAPLVELTTVVGVVLTDTRCHVDFEQVARDTCKLTLVVDGEVPPTEVQSAVEVLLNCIAARQGQKVVFEAETTGTMKKVVL